MPADIKEPDSNDDDRGVHKAGMGRIHHLDWMRGIMLILLMYGHLSRMGLRDGLNGLVQVDDRTYIGAYGGQEEQRSAALKARYISIVRQWCVPLLFWVSGAAAACAWRRISLTVRKFLIYTVIGVVLNAILWLLSPMDETCDPGSRCPGQGIVFDFTMAPWAGPVFPIIYQTWLTMWLMGFIALNTPLFTVLDEARFRLWPLALQWTITCGLYVVIVLVWQGFFPYRLILLAELCFYEAVFLLTLGVTAPNVRPAWMPARALQYLAALTSLLQFAGTPVANSVFVLSPSFGLYILVGFNKFYALGFAMTRSPGEQLVSSYWPLMILVVTSCLPSTNWYLGGNLTYPYFPRMSDRILFSGGSLVLVFILDRLGQWMPARPCPEVLHRTAGVVWLLHPLVITLLIYWGMQELTLMAVCCIAVCFIVAFAFGMVLGEKGKGAKELEEGNEEEEEDEDSE